MIDGTTSSNLNPHCFVYLVGGGIRIDFGGCDNWVNTTQRWIITTMAATNKQLTAAQSINYFSSSR
jgi:hypothetical protein